MRDLIWLFREVTPAKSMQDRFFSYWFTFHIEKDDIERFLDSCATRKLGLVCIRVGVGRGSGGVRGYYPISIQLTEKKKYWVARVRYDESRSQA